MPSSKKPNRVRGERLAAAKTPLKRRRGGLFSMDAEQSLRLVIFGGTALVLLVAAAFIGVGYYFSVIQPRGRMVMRVDDVTVSYSDMKRRMAREYYANPGFQDPESVLSVPQFAYDSLLEELTLISRAESELGVTIDDAEFEKALRTEIGVAEGDDAAFAGQYRLALSESYLHEDEYRRALEAKALAVEVKDKLNESTPAQVPQAKVEVIQVAERAQADAAIARIVAGEPWVDVAKAVSLESGVAQTGGVKEFAFEGQLPAAYDTFAFSAPVGEISTPLQDPSAAGPFYVMRVIERADLPLTETQKPAFEGIVYREWIVDTQAKMTIVDNWTTNDKARADSLAPLYLDALKKRQQLIEEQLEPQPTVVIAPVNTTTTAETPVAGTPASEGAGTPAATVPANGQ